MLQIKPLLELALLLAAAVTVIALGALLLRNGVDDAKQITAALPTRSIRDDSSEARESNRRKALYEFLLIMCARGTPGAIVIATGIGLLVWICSNLSRFN